MKSWIKVGAVCEVRDNPPGTLFRIEAIHDSHEIHVRQFYVGFWTLVNERDLMRTDKARREEKTRKFQNQITKEEDLAQARLLAERHGYAVVRKMP